VNRSPSRPKPGITAVVPKPSGSIRRGVTTRTSPGRAPFIAIGPVRGWLASRSIVFSVEESLLGESCPSIPSRSSSSISSPGSIVAIGSRSGQIRLWLFSGRSTIERSRATLTWRVMSACHR
jgi:hypothetical protein